MTDGIHTIQDVLHKKILRGWVKFPTGGNASQESVSDKADVKSATHSIAMADSVRSRNQQ